MTSPTAEARLRAHVDRIEDEHPPVPLELVDYSVRRPEVLGERFGHVFDYLARVELEVDRNVLELTAMLPSASDIDRRFYGEVWQPQEIHHGLILDELQTRLGRPPAVTDTTTVSPKIRILGALAHLSPIHDIVRMLYYLTGMATERSAVLAYNRLYDGVRELEETAIAETVVAPIRRQEPGHYAFYRLSATALDEQLRPWQRWLTGRLRRISFAPVGANNDEQKADFGGVLTSLGVEGDLDVFVTEISRVEHDLLWAKRQGLAVPTYVRDAMREAIELHRARATG
ncbi:GTP-binding protein LepA [Nocardioides sp. AE5]|uniref:GTP-binding protein LepA n=1 Tax=Nocardioides sp. AE5 TaxID=2962573 RepID=UPI002882CC8D|nr:GTP-binding protein LepA [Nocardioides sp. AE5]MDT0201005.1 GTP-binding protein LepA [Nocardioides sp. AE5]